MNILPGKLGIPTHNLKGIAEFFSDEDCFYLGHGTTGDESTIQSIFETGLRVVNPEAIRPYDSHLRGLDSTSISLGAGSDHLFSYQQKLIENWPHLQSKKIVICALPQKLVLPFICCSPYSDLYRSFYIGSEEDGYSLRPEFIRGYYDVDEGAFIPNTNFYQNLDDDKRQALMNELIACYIDNYAKSSVRSPIDNMDFPKDLVDERNASVQWYKVQLQRLREYEKQKQERATYDFSHDFDDIFYGDSSDSEFNAGESISLDDDLDFSIPEEDWDSLLANTTISDFNEMLHNLKSRREKAISSDEDKEQSEDRGDDIDER